MRFYYCRISVITAANKINELRYYVRRESNRKRVFLQKMASKPFQFRQFRIVQDRATHKVGTDGVLLGAWVTVRKEDRHVLDVGTGTGLIALMLAQRTSADAHIDAVEIDEGDAQQAMDNFAQSPWPEKGTVHHSPIQNFHPNKHYDLIVANPPYFHNGLRPPNTRRSEVRHTGSMPFIDLLHSVARLLTIKGRCAVILPLNEGGQFIRLARTVKLFPIRKTLFRSRPGKPAERLLFELAFEGICTEETEIMLYDDSGEWSAEYKQLTEAFYLER